MARKEENSGSGAKDGRRRILFFPYYLYLNLPLYEQVITTMSDVWQSSIVRCSNHHFACDEVFDEAYFRNANLDVLECELDGVHAGEGRVDQLRRFMGNRKRIELFLEREKPDLIIVSTDLDDVYIRTIIDLAERRGVQVLIFYTCDIEVDTARHFLRRMLTSALRRSHANWLHAVAAIMFRGPVVGTFSASAPIVLTSEPYRTKLIAQGEQSSRISVVALPVRAPSKSTLESTRELLNLHKNSFVITYFTECLQWIYGLEFLEQHARSLSDMFQKLAPLGIRVVVKLHPREDEPTEKMLREFFDGEPFSVIRNVGVEELIAASDLCIAQYSRVLITSALLGKRFLSLNVLGDDDRRIIPKDEMKSLEVNSVDELRQRIVELKEGGAFGAALDAEIARMKTRFGNDELAKKTKYQLLRATMPVEERRSVVTQSSEG